MTKTLVCFALFLECRRPVWLFALVSYRQCTGPPTVLFFVLSRTRFRGSPSTSVKH